MLHLETVVGGRDSCGEDVEVGSEGVKVGSEGVKVGSEDVKVGSVDGDGVGISVVGVLTTIRAARSKS